MLDWNNVIRFVRQRMSLPSTFLEKTDAELQEYLIENTLSEFSNYFPDTNRVAIICGNANYKHPTKRHQWLILDPDGLDIFSIVECYFPFEGSVMNGHPILPAMSFDGLKNWSVEVFKSRFLAPFSMYSYTYKFISPNIVEINNEISPEQLVVEYERMQPPDLSKIPLSMQQKFKEMCLADAMIWIGTIRSMYSDGKITTPFGEIPLSGDGILNKGEELKQKIVSQLEENARPPVVIDTY